MDTRRWTTSRPSAARHLSKKTFVRVTKYPQAALDHALAECKADSTWQTVLQNDSGHALMIDQPEWTADLLLRTA
jgi:hypothetical protein